MKVYFHPRVERFINNLDLYSQARIDKLVSRLSDLGPLLAMPFSKSLGSQLFELRVLSKPQIRLIYTFSNQSIYVLHCFVKKSQKISNKDLKIAFSRLKDID